MTQNDPPRPNDPLRPLESSFFTLFFLNNPPRPPYLWLKNAKATRYFIWHVVLYGSY